MDISLFIADLLHQHDEVNVPLLGTFFRQRSPGFFDQNKGVFVPPSQHLSFKVADTETDLLAEYISQRKNISVSSANYFIGKYVSQVLEALENSGRAELSQLGTLERNQGQYRFQALPDPDMEDNFFGLKPIAELKKEAESPAPVKPVVPEVLPVQEEAVQVPQETAIEEYAAIAPSKKNSKAWVFLFLGLLILAGALTHIFYPEFFEQMLNQVNKNSQPVQQAPMVQEPATLTDSLAKADTIYDALQKQGFEVEKPRDTLHVSAQAEKLNQAQAENITYEIIVAAFSRQDEAETYIKQLKSKGIDAKIADNIPGSKIKISLGSFQNEAAAEKELVRIQNDFNKEAWIARVKAKNIN